MSTITASQAAEALEARVLETLRRVSLGPDGPDVVSARQVFDVVVTGATVRVLLDPELIPEDSRNELAETIGPLVEALPGVERVVVKLRPKSVAQRDRLPGIRRVVGIHSGKGGVGKSTVAVNVGVALARQGLRVGLLDADVYGPSCPTLLGLKGRACGSGDTGLIAPLERHGVVLMSVGFLMPEGQALMWRGPLVDEGLPQLFSDVDWGELDILMVDFPPGTSDVHLAAARHVTFSGIVTVTAPGQISVQDVRRGMEMFADLAVPCLGLVENMTGVQCRRCGAITPLFGTDGVDALAEETGIPWLARIPFYPSVASTSDKGEPIVVTEPSSPAARAFNQVSRRVGQALNLEVRP